MYYFVDDCKEKVKFFTNIGFVSQLLLIRDFISKSIQGHNLGNKIRVNFYETPITTIKAPIINIEMIKEGIRSAG